MFPLALLDEGHVGVALFMTLSGYLFAKLLHGKEIVYRLFFWNRFIRLAPLLILVMAVFAVQQKLGDPSFDLEQYFHHHIINGFIKPEWPNGGWSIAVEMQFYLLLPFIFSIVRRWRWSPLVILAAAIALRTGIYLHRGTIQELSYYTIIGRFDQFLLGIMAFECREFIRGQHWLTGWVVLAFAAFCWWFDASGGYENFGGKFPDTSPLWIFLPTLEGAAFGWFIAYYDSSFKLPTRGFSRVLGLVGTYSYSIYLLHPFVVFELPKLINGHIAPISNFYAACAASLVCFCLVACAAGVTYTFIEKPFLRLRVRYTSGGSAPCAEDSLSLGPGKGLRSCPSSVARSKQG